MFYGTLSFMGSPSPIIKTLTAELLRVYGAEFTGKCILFSQQGWIYFSRPRRDRDGNWAVDPFAKPMKQKQIEQILEELRKMPDLESVIEELRKSSGNFDAKNKKRG